MSWMDSWSRPSTNSKVPAPLYLTGQDVPYCHTCGRVMNSKKATKRQGNEIKYCSDRCRSRKPGHIDRKIEKTIAALLNGEPDSGIDKTAAKSKTVKGDPRLIVTCDEVEELVFGCRFDPEKVYGRHKNRKARGIIIPDSEWKSVDMESASSADDDSEPQHSESESISSRQSVDGGVSVSPNPETDSSINGEGGKGKESAEDLEKRRQGAKRAEEREMVRRAARRGIVFGLEVPRRDHWEQKPTKSKAKSKREAADKAANAQETPTTEIRKAEALMNGTVVEPSFAKGNWSMRWRE